MKLEMAKLVDSAKFRAFYYLELYLGLRLLKKRILVYRFLLK